MQSSVKRVIAAVSYYKFLCRSGCSWTKVFGTLATDRRTRAVLADSVLYTAYFKRACLPFQLQTTRGSAPVGRCQHDEKQH